jgi:hypothetical protein
MLVKMIRGARIPAIIKYNLAAPVQRVSIFVLDWENKAKCPTFACPIWTGAGADLAGAVWTYGRTFTQGAIGECK